MQQQSGCCEVCTARQPLIRHLLPYRGLHRRLCTACVLAAHPGSFCPICFEVFLNNNPPPPRLRLHCFKCPSIAHLSCDVAAPAHAHYLCPPCSNPNFTFFNLPRTEPVQINLHLAKQLLAAASIAFESINNAAVISRINAEIRVKEALLAKAEVGQFLMNHHLMPKEKRCLSQSSDDDSSSS